jgi:HD-like signal output (HDOD) protein
MSLLAKISDITTLPTLPAIVLQLNELARANELGAGRLTRLLEQDPSITANLLKLANSAYYGSPLNRVSTLQAAVTRLGFNTIQSLVLSSSMIRSLSGDSSIIDYRQFWRHSLTAAHVAAMMSSHLAQPADAKTVQQWYTAGLLHDLGVIIYDQYLQRDFQLLVDTGLRKAKTFLEIESKIPAHETHSGVGADLMEFWKMNPVLIDAVRHHHSPATSPQKSRTLAYGIHLCEHILCNWVLGGFEGPVKQLDPHTWEVLGIDESLRTDLIINAQAEVEKSDMVLALEMNEEGMLLRTV